MMWVLLLNNQLTTVCVFLFLYTHAQKFQLSISTYRLLFFLTFMSIFYRKTEGNPHQDIKDKEWNRSKLCHTAHTLKNKDSKPNYYMFKWHKSYKLLWFCNATCYSWILTILLSVLSVYPIFVSDFCSFKSRILNPYSFMMTWLN